MQEGRAPMARRLAMCLAAMFLIGVRSPSGSAQEDKNSIATLKDISVLSAMVEDLPNSAKLLGLTQETIKTDVELKLRLAGIHVVAKEESEKLRGSPVVYVNLNLTDDARAANIDVEFQQNAVLDRNSMWTPRVTTWSKGIVVLSPTSQRIRDYVRDLIDKFLNDWLSVNPKK